MFTLAAAGLTLLAHALSSAAMTRSVSESYLGHEVTPKQAYSFVLPRLGTVVLAGIAVSLLAGIGYVLCIVPGVFIQLWLALTMPVIIIERLGVSQGMGRSKRLMSGNLGKGFVLFLLVFLMTIILTYGLLGLGTVVASHAGVLQATAGVVIVQLFTLVGTVLVTPISSAAAILLYYDLRIRKEGFDLEQLAQRLKTGTAVAGAGPVQQ